MMAHYEIPMRERPEAARAGAPTYSPPGLVDEPGHEPHRKVGLAPFVGSTLNSKAYSPAMTSTATR
jgi:hypothetical protein